MKPRPIIYPTDKDFALVQLTKGKFSKIDIESANEVGKYNWTFFGRYAVRRLSIKNGKRGVVMLHRFLNKTPDGLQTDHINRDELDNRKKNLRSVTGTQNLQNQRKHKIGSSIYKGVVPSGRKWKANICLNKKTKYLGTYETEIKAAKVYDREAIRLFGEYASLNFN